MVFQKTIILIHRCYSNLLTRFSTIRTLIHRVNRRPNLVARAIPGKDLFAAALDGTVNEAPKVRQQNPKQVHPRVKATVSSPSTDFCASSAIVDANLKDPAPRWEIPVVVFPKMPNEDKKSHRTSEPDFDESYYRRFIDGYKADSE